MQEIEDIQTEIGILLTGMIPVPWEKICLYAECDNNSVSSWYAFKETKTGIICTQEFFWERYKSYPMSRRDITINLSNLIRALYKSYITEFGESKKWSTMFYTVKSDFSVNINFEYEMPKGDYIEIHHSVFKRFFGSSYEYIKGKYPY